MVGVLRTATKTSHSLIRKDKIMKKNKFDIPFLTYEAIAELTGISLTRIYKKTEKDYSALELSRLNELRATMKQVQEKFKL